MADAIELEIATPERLLVREQVSEVQVPAKDGYLGILPGHAPLLSLMGTGFLTYNVGATKRYMAVNGGFLEVLPDHVRILADTAERAEEIDVERAKAAAKRAEDAMMNPSVGIDPAAALDAMMRAQARIEAAAKK